MDQEIDEDFYSRQIYMMGLDSMKKMMKASVLVSGLGGLGVEISKNIILAGIKNVTIHDTKLATIQDRASQFYLDESSIGQNRADASISQLKSLNEYVNVAVSTEPLTEEFIQQFDCVVFTDYMKESEILRFSTFCHEKNIKFILTETRGVFSYVFLDFQKHIILDKNGRPRTKFMISYISNDKNGIVTIADSEKHDLEDTDLVLFNEIEGMTELNGKSFNVKVIDRRSFSIGDTSEFHEYKCDHTAGYGTQIVPPVEMNFQSYADQIKNPTVQILDYNFFGRDQQVILAFLASHRIDDQSYTSLINAAFEINNEYKIVDQIDENLFKIFAEEANAVITPMATTFGGIVGQEVIQAISGKFMPINQFLACGYIESLPANRTFTIIGDRYDNYRQVFGNEQFSKMQSLRYFIVGAGAIGCELLKNWAMMGIATAGNGLITITDNDSIEKSNLNRQFLFRNSDIGKMKSIQAAAAVKKMNSEVRIEAHTNKLCSETRTVYTDTFFQSLDGCANALDNPEARLFMDDLCKLFNLPLLESGTQGPIGNVQMIIPNLTVTYGSLPTVSNPEGSIPMCTLHRFPSKIEHCCMWARDLFSGYFDQKPNLVNLFLTTDLATNQTQRVQALVATKEYIKDSDLHTFDDCVKWARLLFEDLFVNQIKDLLHMFPADLNKGGVPFWIGARRCPSPLTYDAKNPTHASFINAASSIIARVYNIPIGQNAHERASHVEFAEWVPSDKEIKIDDDGNEPEQRIDVDENELANELQGFRNHSTLNPEIFEKDNESNGHMDFIASAANLRAENYKIDQLSKLEIKKIAGRIIPAIATTTSLVCGFVSLEAYKVHNIEPKTISDYRNAFLNVGDAIFNISEPEGIKKYIYPSNKAEYTIWSTWYVEGDLTIEEIYEQLETKYGFKTRSINCDGKNIYSNFMSKEKKEARFKTKLSEIMIRDFGYPPLAEGNCLIEFVPGWRDDIPDNDPRPRFVLKIR